MIGTSLSFAVPARTAAQTGADFNPGNIISGAVFSNSNAMTATDIQNFLTAKQPNCDTYGSLNKSYYWNPSTGEVNVNSAGATYVTTTRALYSQRYAAFWNNHTSDSNGNTRSSSYKPNQSVGPYVCLKDYVENPTTHANNLQNPGLSIAGGESASQLIVDAAKQYSINPQVLLVTLQKEQGLVTDDWPWTNEYQIAMGYACPDTSSCDSSFYGFSNQVMSAAKQFRRYLTNPNNYNYVVGNNSIYYNVPSSCGTSSVVAIQNESTAALYNYTPYQPDANVLANTNPTGSSSGPGGPVSDACASYGNRNFWWYFTSWFGSTQTTIPYAWTFAGSNMASDSQFNQPFTNGAVDIAPGATAYLQVKARNNGNQSWSQSIVHLGTSRPDDRNSAFSNGSWLSNTRIQMVEPTVAPGDVGTFNFSITAPTAAGEYAEYFNLVADGITWMNDPGTYFLINVTNRRTELHSSNVTLSSNQTLTPEQYILSADGSTTLQLKSNGLLNLSSDARLTWSSVSINNSVKLVAMQPDGNLVEYAQNGSVIWSSGTSGNPGATLAVQQDGNMVIYSSTGTAIWSSGTSSNPDYFMTPFYVFSGGTLLPGQLMSTPKGNYHLEFQNDGNLVLYNGGQALWDTGTSGKVSNLSMQPDGNLVLYGTNGQALWNSGTAGNYNAFLALQPDGNLVIYTQSGQPVWSSGTANR